MISSANNRKVFKEFSDDGVTYVDSATGVTSSEIRKLFKAFLNNPEFYAAVRSCKTPAEKHKLIRQAGFTPVLQDQLKSELRKSLAAEDSNPEDSEFLDDFLHIAAGTSSDLAIP